MSRNPEQWLGLALIGAAAAGLFRLPAFGLGDLSLPGWALPPLIFILQSANLAFDTFRTLAVARGRRTTAWATGFSQALLFVVAIAGVLQNLSDPWNLVAYAGGFATGTVIGIVAENGLAPGHALLRVISPHRGSAVADALRRQGWGATEIPGRGQDGTVTLIFCHVPRREATQASKQIVSIDPEAFITSESVRHFRGGWRA